MAFEDYFQGGLGGTASGAATGAAIGSIVPGIGTGIGAAVGGGLGLIGGLFQGNANRKARQGRDAARKQLQQASREQYARRQEDIQRALAFFKPVDARMQRLYGQGSTPPPFAPRPY